MVYVRTFSVLMRCQNKRAMRRIKRKLDDLKVRHYTSLIIYINQYVTVFPGEKASVKFCDFILFLRIACLTARKLMQFHKCNGKANNKKCPKKDAVMQWHIQAGGITANLKVKIYFTLPELSLTKTMTWIFHVDDSSKGIYDMILGRDL